MSRTIRRKTGDQWWNNKERYSTTMADTGRTYRHIYNAEYSYYITHGYDPKTTIIKHTKIIKVFEIATNSWEIQEELKKKETKKIQRDDSLWRRGANRCVKWHSRRESRRFATKQIYSCIRLDNEDYFIHNNRYLKRIWWIYD